jgi:voltage-gated potassium channel Kch
VAARTPAPAQREIEARVAGSFSGGTMTTTLATAGYGDLFMPAAQARRFVSTEIARYRALMKIHRIV